MKHIKTIIGTSCFVILMGFAHISLADTYHVEKWGADSGTCGADTDPCASIQQAIDNASANDKIEVGPGTYTENITINKEGLKVRSVAGRYATTILVEVPSDDVVEIAASKVRFGQKGRGFTVSGATTTGFAGLKVTSDTRSMLKIEGNRFSGNYRGVAIRGDKHQVRDNRFEDNSNRGFRCNFCTRLLLQDNQSVNNGDRGFDSTSSSEFSVIRNRASDNGTLGFFIDSTVAEIELKDNVSEHNNLDGISVGDTVDSTIQGNITANNSGAGFHLDQDTPGAGPDIKNNLAVDNGIDGFFLNDLESARFTGNSAITNTVDGVDILPGTTFNRFKDNTTTNSGSCGIKNDSGSDPTYTNHFFGDPAGPNPPGSNDGVCGSNASTGTFATEPSRFKAKTAAGL